MPTLVVLASLGDLGDDEDDEIIANRIRVEKMALHILDKGWDEREPHATWLRWFSVIEFGAT